MDRTQVARPDHLLAAPFSYAEVGATSGDLPAGYRHTRVRADLGSGRATFERAAKRIVSWEMHRRAGLTMITTHPSAVVGAVAVQRVGLGPAKLVAPCRVIAVWHTAHRAGFSYGTLGGHPVAGEEAFGVEWLADDRVVATITSFSRSARWFTRLAGPVGAAVQHLAVRRYVQALRDP